MLLTTDILFCLLKSDKQTSSSSYFKSNLAYFQYGKFVQLLFIYHAIMKYLV